MTPRERHDRGVRSVLAFLLHAGYRVSSEAGIVGGRVDVVRLDEEDAWVELYEVKFRHAESGIGQLVRYARGVEGDPALTLVVPAELATKSLRADAHSAGVRVWRFDFECFEDLRWPERARFAALAYLPYSGRAAA